MVTELYMVEKWERVTIRKYIISISKICKHGYDINIICCVFNITGN